MPPRNNLVKLKTLGTPFEVKASPIDAERVVIKAATKFMTEEEVKTIKTYYRRSKMDIDALIKDVHSCNIQEQDVDITGNFVIALKYVELKLFPTPEKYKPVSLTDIDQYPWKKGVSACEPYFSEKKYKDIVLDKFRKGIITSNRSSFGNLYDEILTDTKNIQDSIAKSRKPIGDIGVYDTLAFARAHLVSEEDPDKIRFVFGCPKPMVITECQFFWPIFARMKRDHKSHCLAWGYETLTGGIRKLTHELRDSPEGTYLALDWKQFDKRTYFSIIDEVYKMWKNHIDFDHGYKPTHAKPVYTPEECLDISMKMKKMYQWINYMAKFSPIRTPDGSRYQRQFAGVPSGLFLTNYLDSTVNAVVLVTLLLDIGVQLDQIDIMRVMGDDSFIKLNIPYWKFEYDQLFDALASRARRRFDFVLSIKKSFCGPHIDGIKILGFEVRNSMPVKPPTELLASLAHPERSRS